MSEPGEPAVPSGPGGPRGAGPAAAAEDAWWDAVYGPAEREARYRPSTGTVDDWFASALGAMGETAPPSAPPAPRAPMDDTVPDLPPIPSVPPPPRVPDPRVGAPRPLPDLDLDPDVLAWPPDTTRPPVPADEPPPPAATAPDPPTLDLTSPPPPAPTEAAATSPAAPGVGEDLLAASDPSASDGVPPARAGASRAAQPAADAFGLVRPSAPASPGEGVSPSGASDASVPDGVPPAPGVASRAEPLDADAFGPVRAFAPAEPPTSPTEGLPASSGASAPQVAPPEPGAASREARAAGAGRNGLGQPPHVPVPTLPDGAALRWGRSRPAAGEPLPEPDALPEADPDDLGALVPDTALELARHGSMTLRAGTVRGEEARALGVPRRDRLVAARFGEAADGLMVVVVASGRGAGEAARLLAASVGRSRAGLLADLRQGAQERLRFGLQRLTARAARVLGTEGAVHAVLAPLDPTNRLRAGFGTGPGALMLLGDDAWYDAYAGRRLTPVPEEGDGSGGPQGLFRFRAVVPEPGDVLMVCTDGLATPLRTEPAVAALLAEHWSQPHAPGGVDFLRQIQARASGHSGDRTAAAIWED
ncbi:hypothetical protein ABH931_007400 [Streptacidiphilus sp. MAP12-33]|uniref:hypothetical protein n=1 Tax=Streptacidiphilus sp. MAP12-33 TaxID=3156266 RepID=UPI0035135E14